MSIPGGAAMVVANVFPTAPDGTLLFPILPGLTLEYKQRPTFNTIVQTAPDRSTARIALDPYPLWEYDLQFGYISDDSNYSVQDPNANPAGMTQLDQIMGLFLACGGRRNTFLMDLSQITKVGADNTVTGVTIGAGDGATTAFQLVRPVRGFLDLITDPIASTVAITITPPTSSTAAPAAGAVSSIVSGLVTLTTAPIVGASISATFSWRHRMRFTADAEEFESLFVLLHTRGALKLVQERKP